MTHTLEGPHTNYGHSRAGALSSGVLMGAGELAREAGFTFPVALTAAAWADAVAWPKENAAHQDETGRLWDVLNMAKIAAMRAGASNDPDDHHRVPFSVYRVPNDPHELEPSMVDLALCIGPGDRGEAVVTITLRDED